MDPNCPLCDALLESSLHLFVFCHAAKSLWAGNVWGCRPDAMQFDNVVVESDAKACMEALKAPIDAVPWRISIISADTLSWAFHGQQFVFWWSPRESNKAAQFALLQDAISGRHEQWMAHYGCVFKENVAYIESFNNAASEPYKLSVNQFVDLTNEEFRAS
ncbi:hypothetical protein CMV_029885 [Castanea mollissima]|uniref:Cathepsin propeptide inhibitor domain-containing protein n=1 Tax=Castanea mollissima TaxID=60419 RepID=A0A8J4Q233_9ROSI|nr:hypothetical protein CMV_029885 [Castanea mollissima]